MSCEECSLKGSCSAANIGEAAFTGTVVASEAAVTSPTPSEEAESSFDLVRLAVSPDPESLIARRCAEQLATLALPDTETVTARQQEPPGSTTRDEQSAVLTTPITALLESESSEAQSPAKPESNERHAVTPNVERAEAALEAEGGISAHANRYSGKDPSECPFLNSMGKAGVEMLERLEAAKKNPNRGKTIAELLAERRQQQSDGPSKKQTTVQAEGTPRQKSDQADQLEVAEHQPIERLPDRSGVPPETIRRTPLEAVAVTDYEAGALEAKRDGPDSLRESLSDQSEDRSSESASSASEAGVLPRSTADAPDTPDRGIDPLSLSELQPAPYQTILTPEEVDKTADAEESLPDTIEAFEFISEAIAGDERTVSRPIAELHPLDIEARAVVNMVGDIVPVDGDDETMTLRQVERDVHLKDLAIGVLLETSEQELDDEHTTLEAFEVVLSEWLTGAAPDIAETTPGRGSTIPVQIAKPTVEQFEPGVQVKVTDVLEAMTQLCVEAGTQRVTGTQEDSRLAVETTTRQLEPLCEQLFELMGLAPDEKLVQVAARDMAILAASDSSLSSTLPSAKELNQRGTREYKLQVYGALQAHLIRPTRQKISRLMALGRYILAGINGLRPHGIQTAI